MFWLLAAGDGRAKNFSVHLEAGGRYRLTPLYDVMSAWPLIGRGPKQLQYETAGLAMAIRSKNAHYRFKAVQTRHWKNLAEFVGTAGPWESMITQVERAQVAIKELELQLPKGFPAQVYDSVRKGIAQRAKTFMSGCKGLR